MASGSTRKSRIRAFFTGATASACWCGAEAANAYVYSDRAAEMLTREWLEAVRRDHNHPCIVTWVPLNESWGVPDLDRLRPATRFRARAVSFDQGDRPDPAGYRQ